VKRLRHKKFMIAAVLSLLLATLAIVLWVQSSRANLHFFSFAISKSRFTLKCSSGTLLLTGPPKEDSDDPIARDLAARMNDDDFVEKDPVERRGVRYAWRQAKEGTPTRLMFDRFGYKKPTDKGMAAIHRLWLAALEDPHRYLCAHMLFLLDFDQWRDANSDWNGPYLLLPLDAAGKPRMPDLRQARQRWHDQVDVRVVYLPLAWLLAPSLIFFVAWLTRPRSIRQVAFRWALNLAALVSTLLLVGAIIIWVRSERMLEGWYFAIRNGQQLTATDGTVYQLLLNRTVTSGGGKLHWYERSVAMPTGAGVVARNSYTGYYAGPLGRFTVSTPAGISHWQIPGIQVDATANQPMPAGTRTILIGPNAAPVQVPRGPLGPPDPRRQQSWAALNSAAWRTPIATTVPIPAGFTPGMRSVIVSWWLVSLILAICPAFWVYNTWRRRRRARIQDEHLCPVCFYDLRATPERCPECGTIVAAAQPGDAQPSH
jgi:hypothetical protein